MQLHVAVIDDNQTDTKYVSGLVKLWSEAAFHTVRIRAFQSAEEFLFHYEEDKEFDILLLDIEMGDMNGVELAKKISSCDRKIVMVIGGAFGFTDAVRQRADYLLALSKFTVTHEMARLILIEQLYRACTITAGKKYHH